MLVILLTVQHVAAQRAFTPRYTNPSVRGNIKFVANNILTSNGTITTEAPPTGTATNNANPGVNLDVDNATTLIFPWASAWKFCDSGYLPVAGALNFTSPAYPDGGWQSATPSSTTDIGYGDNDEVTPYVYSGCGARPATHFPVCGSKSWTTYFRRQFTITNVAAYKKFILNVHRDDGVVIYINGTEVVRDNMPAGAINNGTAATNGVEGATEDVTLTIGTSAFVNGTNTIAVELHQKRTDNSADGNDLSFRLQLTGDSTINSTTADLTLNSCSEVLWAGLYWGVTLGNSGLSAWRSGYDTLWFKTPAGAYTKVTSVQNDLHDSSAANNHTGYQCFADVTSLLTIASPNGTYTVANMTTPVSTGKGNQAGGWCLVIAFKDPTTIPRNLVVFDGFQIVSVNTQKDIPFAGFTTPVTGPVSCELGAVVYDGDRNSGDGFFFKQDSAVAGAFTNLSNTGTSGNNDSWNSTISYLGANVTTRNPAHANTLGFDADIIQLPNGGNTVLGNNKTSARIRISAPSGGENFNMQVVTSAISVSNPSFTLIKSATDLSGGAWVPGDSLRYTLINKNNGVDTSTGTILIDTIPGTAVFKPGSIRINGVLRTDAAGDDAAEYDPIGRRVIVRLGVGATSAVGGEVRPTISDTVTFTVNATTSCQVLSCTNIASNQAHVTYVGKNSAQSLADHSGYLDGGGCFVEAPITNAITGSCLVLSDTSIINTCPVLTVTLPAAHYNGYTFYRALPFTPGNVYNAAIPIGTGGTYYAYLDAGAGCSDTVRLNVLHQLCPDLDDDDDGIPDLIESNGLDAFADADSDGILNFADHDIPGFVDVNNDGVNDNMDADLDGVPNQLDRDSDNDGIPDVVEAGGVDADGDGRIDNFTDTDADGLSQNVDANNTGAAGSGNGLAAGAGLRDTDGDGIPDYHDLDSDNDGIPDVLEAGGTDANNDGMIDSYATDTDADGFADAVDGDVGNDNIAENSANALLRTGADINGDGRADSYPFKNMDADSKPNPYDLDSDGDGIVDIVEAGFPDTNNDGKSDGGLGTRGWSSTIDALGSITLLNSDGSGNPDFIDIDSDNDGIPDCVEGISTGSYIFASGSDTDGDGIDNNFDTIIGFGGKGITPNDQDADGTPDYRDTDTDNDGQLDIVEGNDMNANCDPDDNVTLTNVDTDGDGLDDRFDVNNASAKGTSAFMGAAGSLSGDVSPGSNTHVQTCSGNAERDWRYLAYVLEVDFLGINAQKAGSSATLRWVVTCDKIIDHFDVQRSADGIHFTKIGAVAGTGKVCKATPFVTADNDLTGFANVVYYRAHAVAKDGNIKMSPVTALLLKKANGITILPNPANSFVRVNLVTPHASPAIVKVLDAAGKYVSQKTQSLVSGANSILLDGLDKLPEGVYTLQIIISNEVFNQRLIVRH
jgi:uncharacterized repeat protein (TIGR01451 family)